MDYLYKLTVEIDDDKVRRLQQHDLSSVYQTVRHAFEKCNFQEQSQDNRELVFTIGEGKDSFSEVGIVTNSLYDSWLGPYLKRMEWFDGKMVFILIIMVIILLVLTPVGIAADKKIEAYFENKREP